MKKKENRREGTEEREGVYLKNNEAADAKIYMAGGRLQAEEQKNSPALKKCCWEALGGRVTREEKKAQAIKRFRNR